MQTLNTIQKLSRVGRVISKVIFILCLVGGIACIAGIISLALIPESFKLGGVTVSGLISSSSELSTGAIYAALGVGLVMCAGEAVLSRFAGLYFRRELEAGTPFTLAGAKELIRLGILAICIPAGTSLIAAIVYATLRQAVGSAPELDVSSYSSIGLGVMFIVTGLICRHGAELAGEKGEIAR